MFTFKSSSYNKSDEQIEEFDLIIGHIEDILVDARFQGMLYEFMERYWMTFEDVEENKLIYTEIFMEYSRLIESYINCTLMKKKPHFSMQNFLKNLEMHKHLLDGEVFEVLFSLSDFMKFKETILDYKKMKEGKIINLNLNITSLTHK